MTKKSHGPGDKWRQLEQFVVIFTFHYLTTRHIVTHNYFDQIILFAFRSLFANRHKRSVGSIFDSSLFGCPDATRRRRSVGIKENDDRCVHGHSSGTFRLLARLSPSFISNLLKIHPKFIVLFYFLFYSQFETMRLLPFFTSFLS